MIELTAFILLWYVATDGVSSPVAISGIATQRECERIARLVIQDIKPTEDIRNYYKCIEYKIAR